jgi:V-type H+-transporting ATPase subunit a
MTFALCLQVPNHLKFKRYSDIYTNFIPQIIFLQSIFGYLVLCILYKWSIDWSTASIQPPSLLNMLITMFLQPGSVPAHSQLYRGQGTIQLVLLMTAAICVPWLLISKPYLLWKEMNRTQDHGYLSLNRDESAGDDTPQTAGVRLAEEEGRALIQTDDEEAVRFISTLSITFD